MADASCGSSNPAKGLAHHIEQDRSHQQDRITTAPQHPAQSFRSTNFTPGISDQFNAFQQQDAVPLPPPMANLEPSSGLPFHTVQLPPMARLQPGERPAGMPLNAGGNWVNEFQGMNLSAAQATPGHAQPGQTPNMGLPGMPNPMQFHSFPGQPAFAPFQPLQRMHLSQRFHSVLLDPDVNTFFDHMGPPPQQEFMPDVQAEIEEQFEEAMNEWMLQNGDAAETGLKAGDAAEAEDESKLEAEKGDEPKANLDGASAEPTTQEAAAKEDPNNVEKNDEELARVAQQLVDCFADNQSDKFKNSEFLAVMRRIASRQLTVQGNDLVETPQPSEQSASEASAQPQPPSS
ncbi:hypothetical protein GGR50DRAFT_647536 [Xylaria sp. CBS 124048]|nr:hypothetical protein GGR50DRAFT_647536 [Xylaria sp. CBS 124048]